MPQVQEDNSTKQAGKTPSYLLRYLSDVPDWESYGEDDELFIQGFPKVELHVHLDGSFDPDFLWDYLQTNSDLYGGSVLTCTRQVWQEGGAAAFLRGSVPRLAHKVPANAFFFLFYETFRRLLRVEEAVKKQQEQVGIKSRKQ